MQKLKNIINLFNHIQTYFKMIALFFNIKVGFFDQQSKLVEAQQGV